MEPSGGGTRWYDEGNPYLIHVEMLRALSPPTYENVGKDPEEPHQHPAAAASRVSYSSDSSNTNPRKNEKNKKNYQKSNWSLKVQPFILYLSHLFLPRQYKIR